MNEVVICKQVFRCYIYVQVDTPLKRFPKMFLQLFFSESVFALRFI